MFVEKNRNVFIWNIILCNVFKVFYKCVMCIHAVRLFILNISLGNICRHLACSVISHDLPEKHFGSAHLDISQNAKQYMVAMVMMHHVPYMVLVFCDTTFICINVLTHPQSILVQQVHHIGTIIEQSWKNLNVTAPTECSPCMWLKVLFKHVGDIFNCCVSIGGLVDWSVMSDPLVCVIVKSQKWSCLTE